MGQDRGRGDSDSECEQERIVFAKELLKCLVRNETNIDNKTMRHDCDTHPESSDEESSEDDDGEVGDNGNERGANTKVEEMPELLRRLHQVLTLYENVATISHPPYQPESSTLKSFNLKSLTMPVEICLKPLSSKEQKKKRRSQCQEQISILAEPLLSSRDLSLQVLRTCRVSHPYWISYCQG